MGMVCMLKTFYAKALIGAIVHVIVAITGASGIKYGVRLLECLPGHTTAVLSSEAARMCEGETGLTKEDILAKADDSWDNDNMFSPLASGSIRFDASVIVPCSMSTMSKVASGIADNLVTRIASVALKERRKLVIVPRETPLSTIHLQNLLRLSEAGAVIMPACPAFYPRPESVDEMIDFVVGRIMDQLSIEHGLYRRWDGEYIA
jgi:4-hydroxy-3-polyprenylbenzoate decarboxylase